jgi:hypothetical protein
LEEIMHRRIGVSVHSLGLVVILCVASAEASAQCSPECVQTAFHLSAGVDWSGNNTIKIGMADGADGLRYPAVCVWSNSAWVLTAAGSKGYTSSIVTDDLSFCAGAGNDHIVFQRPDQTDVCLFPFSGAPVLLRGMNINGATFYLSGDGGDDTIDMLGLLSTESTGGTNFCGGTGRDLIIGSGTADYGSAGADNDFVDGKWKADNLRGGSGNDVLRVEQGFGGGPDKLRGDTGRDCLWVELPISSSSSCGAESNDLFHPAASGLAFPSDCEIPTTNCCTSLPGALCPPVFQ